MAYFQGFSGSAWTNRGAASLGRNMLRQGASTTSSMLNRNNVDPEVQAAGAAAKAAGVKSNVLGAGNQPGSQAQITQQKQIASGYQNSTEQGALYSYDNSGQRVPGKAAKKPDLLFGSSGLGQRNSFRGL